MSTVKQIGELKGSVPTADLKLITRLLTTAAATLKKAAVPVSPTLEERRATHSNSHQPWTDEDDQRLRELAAAPGANIRDLMEAFGRSRSAIKARLPRVGVHEELPSRPQPTS
jgi:lysophospholipase L1-like esterase